MLLDGLCSRAVLGRDGRIPVPFEIPADFEAPFRVEEVSDANLSDSFATIGLKVGRQELMMLQASSMIVQTFESENVP